MYSKLHSLIPMTLIFLLTVGCQKSTYPGIDKMSNEDKGKPSPGVYTKVVTASTNEPVSGELIFLDDSLILFTDRNQFVRLPTNDIQSMTSQLSGAKTKTYLLITGLTLIPMMVGLIAQADRSDSPKAIGLMATSPGLIVALIESLKKPEIISYPEDTPLDEFRQHARHPEILPFEPKIHDLVSSASIERYYSEQENAAVEWFYTDISIKKR